MDLGKSTYFASKFYLTLNFYKIIIIVLVVENFSSLLELKHYFTLTGPIIGFRFSLSQIFGISFSIGLLGGMLIVNCRLFHDSSIH